MTVICPCCAGQKYLLVYDEAAPGDPPVKLPCMHCDATGRVRDDMLHEEAERDHLKDGTR